LAEAFGQGAVATIAQNLVMDFALASGSKSGDALPRLEGCKEGMYWVMVLDCAGE
jgi:hypothetical protein